MKTFYRIAALGNRPSGQEFETVQAACDAAKQALKEFPGGIFEIYKCVAMVQYTEASTFWMDGEGPPKKPRYRELEDGEVFQYGDEYISDNVWTPVPNWSFGATYNRREFPSPHRRPL